MTPEQGTWHEEEFQYPQKEFNDPKRAVKKREAWISEGNGAWWNEEINTHAPTEGPTDKPNSEPILLRVSPSGTIAQGKYIWGGASIHCWQRIRQGENYGGCRIGTSTLTRGQHHPQERDWKKSQWTKKNFTGNNPCRGPPSNCWYNL